MRLDKFLSEMGIGTRSEVKKLLKSQKVTVNGETITKSETKIDTDKVWERGTKIYDTERETKKLLKEFVSGYGSLLKNINR